MTEETLIIETPEHVELQFALATVGNRFLACAIDHLIQVVTLVLTYILFYNLSAGMRGFESRITTRIEEGNLWLAAVLILALFVIIFGYFVIFETVWSGQTPGKRWLKLRVIQEDGRPISFFAALTRNLLRGADIQPVPFYSLGILFVFGSAQSKRLGDFVAGTVVVKERATEAPSFDEVFESEVIDSAMRRVAEPVPFTGDVRVIEPPEIAVVESFLRRRYALPDLPRQWLAWRVALPLLEKIRPSFDPTQFNYEGFLEELLARYRVQVKYRD